MPPPSGLPATSCDPAQIKADLTAHGVAFHADFLSGSEVAALRQRVLEQAELEVEQGVAETSLTGTASELQFSDQAASAGARFQVVSFLPNKGRVFLDLMQDARILDYCSHVFSGVPFYLAGYSATIVRQGAIGQVIHCDVQAWPLVAPVPVMLNVAIALSDYTPEMGATRFVPGTMHNPPPRIGFDEATGQVTNLDSFESTPCDLKAGSLALWDGRVWHGQGSSISDQDRLVVLLTYVMHMVRSQDNYTALLHDDVYETLSDAEKRLLGFEVHFEYAGRVAPRHAADRRANTNYVYPFVPELTLDGTARAVPRPGMRIGRTSTQAEII